MSKKSLCVIACLMIGISVFLPFVSVSFFGTSMSKSLIDRGDGIIIVVIAVIGLLFSAFEKYIPALIAGLLSLGMFIFENADLSSKLGGGTEGQMARSLLQKSAGYYLLLIGSIVLVAFAILGIIEKKREG